MTFETYAAKHPVALAFLALQLIGGTVGLLYIILADNPQPIVIEAR